MAGKKLYFIAGERSGDLHGQNLIRSLKEKRNGLEFRGIGGDGMKEAGLDLFIHYKEVSFMGVWEVITHLDAVFRAERKVKKDIASFRPDLIVLIDFGGFNMRIAAFARKLGIPVAYYITPKVWAWNTGRVKKIKEYVDKAMVILPFEKKFFDEHGVSSVYVGNPLLDSIAQFEPDPEFLKKNYLEGKKIIAVLPGSRHQEVEKILHTMLSITVAFPDYTFVIAAVSNLPLDLYKGFLRTSQIRLVTDRTYDLLNHAEAAIVTSGTATLETALFNVPQVVCYATSPFTALVVRIVIKVKFISLVNLIAGKEVVRELLQDKFNPNNLRQELKAILAGPKRKQILEDYIALKAQMGEVGASEHAAFEILQMLQERS